MAPMAHVGQEAIGSMGTDTPISALSSRPKLLHTYFKQNFAQVTNPPIDPIREELVMSLVTFIGPRPNLLDHEGASTVKRLEAAQPILLNEGLEKIRGIGEIADNDFRTITLDITYAADKGADGMAGAIDRLSAKAEKAVHDGSNIIILSDRLVGPDRIPIPSLLATSAVHHHLIKTGLRTSVGLVVETGEYTGRSPKDKFIVEEATSRDNIWWGAVNKSISEDHFAAIRKKILDYYVDRDLFVQDCHAGADIDYQLDVRVVTETAFIAAPV